MILGIKRESMVAGRLEICIDNIWRAVVDRGWDDVSAGIACEKMGFPREGTKLKWCFMKYLIQLTQEQHLVLAHALAHWKERQG